MAEVAPAYFRMSTQCTLPVPSGHRPLLLWGADLSHGITRFSTPYPQTDSGSGVVQAELEWGESGVLGSSVCSLLMTSLSIFSQPGLCHYGM